MLATPVEEQMLLDAVLLRSFVAVCDTRGFTRAARLVHLTQSAVSLHIKRLEEQLGHRLFERNAHRLALTPEGEILLSYARRIVALHEEAGDRLRRGQVSGAVRLGAPEYFDPHLLASLLAQFARRYPAVSPRIEMGIGPDIAALFDNGALDVAIVNRELGEGDGVVLWQDTRVWAAAADTALAPDQPVPLAVFPPHCAWRRLALERLNLAGRSWRIVLQSAGVAGVAAAVEAGFGIGIYAGSSLSAAVRPLGIAEGLPPLPDFEYALRIAPKASPAAAAGGGHRGLFPDAGTAAPEGSIHTGLNAKPPRAGGVQAAPFVRKAAGR